MNTNETIQINPSDHAFGDEGEEFAAWLIEQGYHVRMTSTSDTHSELWEQYCNA